MCPSLGVIREHSSAVERLPYKQKYHLVRRGAVLNGYTLTLRWLQVLWGTTKGEAARWWNIERPLTHSLD